MTEKWAPSVSVHSQLFGLGPLFVEHRGQFVIVAVQSEMLTGKWLHWWTVAVVAGTMSWHVVDGNFDVKVLQVLLMS